MLQTSIGASPINVLCFLQSTTVCVCVCVRACVRAGVLLYSPMMQLLAFNRWLGKSHSVPLTDSITLQGDL